MKVITFEVTAFKDQSSKVISFLALYFQTEDSFEFLIISYQKDEGNVRIVLRKEHTLVFMCIWVRELRELIHLQWH